MKILMGIICLFFSIPAFSQVEVKSKIDSTNSQMFVGEGRSIPLNLYKMPLTVIDGMPCDSGNVKNIDYSKILIIDTLKGGLMSAIYGESAKKGVINIVTKQFAISNYKKRLSKFSRKYRKFLITYNDSDSNCLYVINGKLIAGKQDDITRKLYNISRDKIKSVNCSKNPDFREDNKTELVAITIANN